MYRRRKKKKRDQGSVEMNLAAMLDMAFQLLTFFILTFKPAPTEGQLALNLPPPVEKKADNPETMGQGGMQGIDLNAETLHLNVTANENGDVTEVRIETNPVARGRFDQANSDKLNKELQTKISGAQSPFDRIQIAVDGRLRYGELMKIIDVCHQQKLPDGLNMQKISFTEVDFSSK